MSLERAGKTARKSAPSSGKGFTRKAPSEGPGIGTAIAGGAAAVGLGALLKNPALAKTLLGKASAARQQMMLSGLALPKSLLGNVGATVEASIEGKTLKPIKELFSRQTLKDAKQAYKLNAGLPGAGAGAPHQMTLPGPVPGRLMGAMDEATQKALLRSGASREEAMSAVLQSPLEGRLAKALDSPMSRYLIPFRRTPFNQFFEGLERLPGGRSGSNTAKAVYMGAGAAHGAATADDNTPISIPLATAAASRYGLPYALSAIAARNLAGGQGGGDIASTVLPVGEYGFESAATPSGMLRPFTRPAALTALEKILGGQ